MSTWYSALVRLEQLASRFRDRCDGPILATYAQLAAWSNQVDHEMSSIRAEAQALEAHETAIATAREALAKRRAAYERECRDFDTACTALEGELMGAGLRQVARDQSLALDAIVRSC